PVPGAGVTEAWTGPAPVYRGWVRPAPGGRHPEAVLPKAGARLAGDHLLGQLVQELGPAWASVRHGATSSTQQKPRPLAEASGSRPTPAVGHLSPLAQGDEGPGGGAGGRGAGPEQPVVRVLLHH